MRSVAVNSSMNAVPYTENIKSQPLSLIIDDETDICFLLVAILQNENIKNVCVNNLNDALLFLQSHDPAIIFLDNKLPDGSGVEYIRAIKKNHPNTRIIMITAHDNFRDKAIKEGADDFITKPFSRSSILKSVESIVS